MREHQQPCAASHCEDWSFSLHPRAKRPRRPALLPPCGVHLGVRAVGPALRGTRRACFRLTERLRPHRGSCGLRMGCGDAPRGRSAEIYFVSCAGGGLVGSFSAADPSGGANEQRVQGCSLVFVEAGEDLILD
jgi:hypothetical protein